LPSRANTNLVAILGQAEVPFIAETLPGTKIALKYCRIFALVEAESGVRKKKGLRVDPSTSVPK
jgi:hypothetical protein